MTIPTRSAGAAPDAQPATPASAPDAFAPPERIRGEPADDSSRTGGGAGGTGGGTGTGAVPRAATGIRAPLAVAARSWRQLTSMRTALLLLFLLALAAIPGSMLPQRNLNPLKVEEYFADHPTLAPILDRFGAFAVFSAPWFAAIYLLLFISLIGCLVSRVRWHAKALVGRPPKAPARPARLPGGRSWHSPLPPERAVAEAAAVLRRRRFRVATQPSGTTRPDGSPDHSLAAERGYLRETGNLVFHIALLALLAGVGLGSWYGYQGTVLVITGDGFTNTLVSYDQFSRGQLVDPADLRPFSMTLDDFKATYQPDGQPADFRADVAYAEDLDSPARDAVIRVNYPLAVGDAKIYLIGHGYAPHFILRDAEGAVVWESYVPCTPRDGMFTSTCTVKIGDTGLPPVGTPAQPQQLAFTGVFTPTTVLDPAEGYISTFPAAVAPGLTIAGFVGNLHIDEGIPQNVYALDTRDLRQITLDGPIGDDRQAQVLALNNPDQRTITGLPGGLELEVAGVREFATFQTKSDPYKGWVLVASIVIIVGLVASLRVRRRRIWVRVLPAAAGGGHGGGQAGSTVEVGGLARTDADAFAAELRAVCARLRTATQAADAMQDAEPGTAQPVGTSRPAASPAAVPSAATSSQRTPPAAVPSGETAVPSTAAVPQATAPTAPFSPADAEAGPADVPKTARPSGLPDAGPSDAAAAPGSAPGAAATPTSTPNAGAAERTNPEEL